MRTFQPDLGITATLNFEGCITEKNIDAAPQLSGIYVAFVCNKMADNNGDYHCSRIDQPIVNIQHKDRYNGKSYVLRINCEGDRGVLRPKFTAVRYIG